MSEDFDQRQLNQMKHLISLLQKRQISISKFVSDQWSLVEMLKMVDMPWRENYTSLVNEIEDLYAAALDKNKKEMDQEDINLIDEILKKMLLSIDGMSH